MAINVYMVFFMAYNPNNFHKHLWAYCLVCFGVPAIFAFVCLLYVPNGQRIYGNATVSLFFFFLFIIIYLPDLVLVTAKSD